MHEAGHSIGLGHSDAGTVMDAYYRGVQTGLKADDIACVQALYGARTEDVFDLTLRNDTKESASTVGDLDTFADLTTQSDVDWWKVVVPDINNGSMIVNINVREHTLLAPSLKIYDVDNNIVADLTNTYGQSVSFTINNVVAGQVYYLLVDGASRDEFGMGKYNIIVDFGNGGNNDIIQPDRFEPNDSINLASKTGSCPRCGWRFVRDQ